MEAEDINPPIDAAIVSDAHSAHSSDDEDHDWLAKSAVRSAAAANRLQSVEERANEEEIGDNDDQMDEVDSDEDEINENTDELYCANMDDEDEAWVYKHMRSGKEELVYVQTQRPKESSDNAQAGSQSNDTPQEVDSSAEIKDLSTYQPVTPQHHMQQARLLKPRNSDAVLSCPRCFTTVCMDCQQHESYSNQYRAMFVMNIGVDWNKRMIYDESVGGLKLYSATGDQSVNNRPGIEAIVPDRIPHDLDSGAPKNDNQMKDLYYSVHCGYCHLEVAALDMNDEIYYFFGCIASA